MDIRFAGVSFRGALAGEKEVYEEVVMGEGGGIEGGEVGKIGGSGGAEVHRGGVGVKI